MWFSETFYQRETMYGYIKYHHTIAIPAKTNPKFYIILEYQNRLLTIPKNTTLICQSF